MFQTLQNLRDILRFHDTNLRQRFDALPGGDGLWVYNMGNVFRKNCIELVLGVPLYVGSQDAKRTVANQGIGMTQ